MKNMKNKLILSSILATAISSSLFGDWFINGKEIMSEFPLALKNRSIDNGGLLSSYEAAIDGVGVIINGNGRQDSSDININNSAYNALVYKYGQEASVNGLKLYEQVLIGTNILVPTLNDREKAIKIKNDYNKNADSGLLLVNGTACDDSNAQTINDKIINSFCIGDCFDDDSSTIDTMSEGVCLFTQNPADNTCTGGFAGDITTDITCGAQALTSTDILNYVGLTTGINIYLDNNNINSIEGLAGLRDVQVRLELSNNNLTNVDGLESLFDVSGYLFLNDNSIKNLTGLRNLTSAYGIILENNNLTNLNGLDNLTSTGYLLLTNNNLTSLVGLEKLNLVNQLWLGGNSLTTLDGLNGLTTVGEFIYANGNNLNNINALSSLLTVVDLYLSNNNLQDVNALNKLVTIEYLELINNNLTDLSGLTNITTMDTLLIYGNSNLHDLTPLNNTQITNVLKIENRDYTGKLEANSWICLNGVINDMDANVLPKSLICKEE